MNCPPEIAEKKRFDAKVEIALQKQMSTFRGYVETVDPSYEFYRHCEVLGNVLDRVARGELKRVMVFMGPRHGKSQTVSRLFPGYYLFKQPRHQVGLASYGADLAESLSRDARENYRRTGRKVMEDASALTEWHTEFGGKFWCAGVGGSLTGKGGNILIIDDPVKGEEEASSQLIRDNIWQWWNFVWYTRREPGAALVLVMTRWNPDDLAGRLLEQEKTSPQNWHIVNFSAIKDIPQEFPKTCTVEPDWREWGEALCPERFDVAELKRTQANIGQSAWLSLYQQRPTDLSGSIWKREWFQTYDPEALNGTKIENVGLDWDTAYTEKEENSATAYIKAGVGSDGKIYVMGFNYDWLEFPEALEWVKELGGPDYIEQKASGKSIVQALRKAQLYAREVPVKGGDKVARTKIVTPLVESGKVLVNKNILNALLDDPRQGILKFKSSQDPGTDVNDAFVQCLNRLRPFVVDKEPEREHSWWGTREVLEEDDPGPASWKDAFRV